MEQLSRCVSMKSNRQNPDVMYVTKEQQKQKKCQQEFTCHQKRLFYFEKKKNYKSMILSDEFHMHRCNFHMNVWIYMVRTVT